MEQAILIGITLASLSVPVLALKTGKMPGPGGYLVVKRDEKPTRFWMQLILYCSIPVLLIYAAIERLVIPVR
jgi:hypothetical protein